MIIGTNFKLSSAKFLDDRQLCKDYNTLIANVEGIIYPPGFEVFCEYENKYYQYVSDTNGGYIWEERKSGVSDGTSASIKDDTISEEYTWSSAHIDSMRIDLEALITQANDYVDEIDERMLYIEGKFQWFEYFDGSYESLKDKPTIPTKISELEDDNEIMIKLEGKVDIEEGKTLIDVQELNRLSNIEQYDDTEVKNRLLTVEANSHTHNNGYIIDSITEEMVNQWNEMGGGVEDYNYLINKPIIRIGEDPDLVLNVNDLNNKGVYVINGIIDEERFAEELCVTQLNDSNTMITLIMLNSMKKVVLQRDEEIEEEWHIIKKENYGIDKNNAKITDTLTIGEDKIILDKEGNGWYGGKVSQEGIPTEDKDLVTKGYVDNKFATSERVSAIEKENARRDVIIEALVNGRRRTVETVGNDVDLIFSTEKDKVWIDKIEGETLVNVCDQEEPIAITKSYTVEGTNHVPLQGEYDGKARPVVHGNTLVNHNVEYDKSVITGGKLDNTHGTEILNLEGTPGCEIKVDIDGHTALNLSTKKEDILCKSFDSASGNEINLVAEENSVSDLVIQGNTMVNLVQKKGASNDALFAFSGSKTTFKRTLEGNYCVYESTLTEGNNEGYISINTGSHSLLKPNTKYTIMFTIKENTGNIRGFAIRATADPFYASNGLYFNSTYAPTIGVHTIVVTTDSDISSYTGLGFSFSPVSNIAGYFRFTIGEIMLFEGDLTQTPELIPTEYVEGLQSTFEDKLIPYSIYNGDNLTSITETQYQLPLTVEVGKIYTITTTANVGTTENHKYQYGVYSADGLTNYLEYESCSPTQTFVCDKANILFKVRMYPSYSGDDYSFVLDEVQDKFMIVEGDWSDRLDLLTEEYFGKYRVDMSSHGKNLFDGTWIYNEGIDGTTGATWIGSTRNRTDFIPIKANTRYVMSGASISVARFYDSSRIICDTRNATVSPSPANAKYLRLSIDNTQDFSEFQIEEGTEATEYEPYYGTSKTVYLNSPLLDGDELVMKDGKLCHYHKMGMVVLNGSENWIYNVSNDTIIRFYYNPSMTCKQYVYGVTSDKFPSNGDRTDAETILQYKNEGIIIGISKSKLSTTDIAGFKQWLSENPTTVVYELAEPWYEEIGVYGKIVLDGSSDENWFSFNQSSGTISYAGIQIPSMKVGYTTKIICDKFETLSNGEDYDQTYTKEQCYPYHITSSPNVGIIYFHVFNSRLSSYTKEGWIQYLQSNPITVFYELAEPQYIDEDMRFNIATNSTIEYQSSVPMANTQFLPYINNLPLLESSTEYRVTFDCDVEGIELMVSLGGTSQTITSALHNELSFITPSLQTDGKLTIDGYGIAKIDNVLITSGNMKYEYFEGLKSGFELSNYIKYDKNNYELIAGYWSSTGEFKAGEFILYYYILKVTPNTTYTIKSNNTNYVRVVELNKNKEWLSRVIEPQQNAFEYTFTTSPNTYYLDIRNNDLYDIEIEEIYKATIRIQNPNAPIFGKGGRL